MAIRCWSSEVPTLRGVKRVDEDMIVSYYRVIGERMYEYVVVVVGLISGLFVYLSESK